MDSMLHCLLGPLSPSRRGSRGNNSAGAGHPSLPPPPIPAPFVVIPLYIYPSAGAWDPLTHAINTHKDLHFLVVINPNSGPGPDRLPDTRYRAEVGLLTRHANVHLLGYVPVTYARRSPVEIRVDINLYRGWSEGDDQLRVDGIFFDEVLSDPASAPALGEAARHVHATWARDLGLPGIVVYNPGVPVADVFFADADYVVVFEQTEEKLRELADGIAAGRERPVQAGRMIACLHSYTGTGPELETMLSRQLDDLGITGVFVTDQDGGGYNRWPAAWEEQTAWVAGRQLGGKP